MFLVFFFPSSLHMNLASHTFPFNSFHFRMTIIASCVLKLHNFPLDSQKCHLEIGSCKYLSCHSDAATTCGNLNSTWIFYFARSFSCKGPYLVIWVEIHTPVTIYKCSALRYDRGGILAISNQTKSWFSWQAKTVSTRVELTGVGWRVANPDKAYIWEFISALLLPTHWSLLRGLWQIIILIPS